MADDMNGEDFSADDEDHLWAAYADTVVRFYFDGSIVEVAAAPWGKRGKWLFETERVHIITAYNPRSRLLSEKENEARHKALGEQLNKLDVRALSAIGTGITDPPWQEESYCAIGLDNQTAFDVAAEWEQNALFTWSRKEWEITGVLLPTWQLFGWQSAVWSS